MARVKTKTSFFCQECGNESLKWVGKCPGCGAWNTMVEELKPAKSNSRSFVTSQESMTKPQKLKDVEIRQESRLQTSKGS